ncbi:unnamed protein product [Blepharisma stoltei]|uniref:TNFR-Cys domain-containing protein n=1 Tax=Blepharisma stoltei TaxID=1481888 RepID=A0AAU9JIQ6_9CILI|nr:unnamed protein product [Blepharisma stoltei]
MLSLLMVFLKILQSFSCSNTCKYCKILNEAWIYNPCSGMTCSLNSTNCDPKCKSCDPTSETCSNLFTACSRDKSICGYPINYYTVVGNILSSAEISSGTICYWIIDGHSYYDSYGYDTLSFSYMFMGV